MMRAPVLLRKLITVSIDDTRSIEKEAYYEFGRMQKNICRQCSNHKNEPNGN